MSERRRWVWPDWYVSLAGLAFFLTGQVLIQEVIARAPWIADFGERATVALVVIVAGFSMAAVGALAFVLCLPYREVPE